MIGHQYIKCKLCGKDEYMAWHPFWVLKEMCWECRDKMVKRHKNLLDPIMKKVKKITDEFKK